MVSIKNPFAPPRHQGESGRYEFNDRKRLISWCLGDENTVLKKSREPTAGSTGSRLLVIGRPQPDLA
jgi:hypothetical protein